MKDPWHAKRQAGPSTIVLLALLIVATAAYPGAFAGHPPPTPGLAGWGKPMAVPVAPADLASLPFQAHLVFDTVTGELRWPGTAGYFATWWQPGGNEVMTVIDSHLALYDAADQTARVSPVKLEPAFASWSPGEGRSSWRARRPTAGGRTWWMRLLGRGGWLVKSISPRRGHPVGRGWRLSMVSVAGSCSSSSSPRDRWRSGSNMQAARRISDGRTRPRRWSSSRKSSRSHTLFTSRRTGRRLSRR